MTQPAPPGPDPSRPTPEAPRTEVLVRLPLRPVRGTYVFLGLIGLTFAAQLLLSTLLGFDPIINWGAKENTLIARGEVWRLLTAIFIHASVLHFLFNAYALYYLGRQIEMFYGSLRFVLLFLLAGLAGSAASMLLNRAPSVGASGAIFGLIGAEAVFLYQNRRLLGSRGRRALQNIAFILVLNLVIGLQGRIDNWAHLGGLSAGVALGWFIGPVWAVRHDATVGGPPTVHDQHPLVGARWVAVGAVALAVVSAATFAAALYR